MCKQNMSLEQRIEDAIKRFPATFGLRAYPGTFRISRSASYESQGQILLYTQVKRDGLWLDFAKGTEGELRSQIVLELKQVNLPEGNPFPWR